MRQKKLTWAEKACAVNELVSFDDLQPSSASLVLLCAWEGFHSVVDAILESRDCNDFHESVVNTLQFQWFARVARLRRFRL